jgi:hypothetical protein
LTKTKALENSFSRAFFLSLDRFGRVCRLNVDGHWAFGAIGQVKRDPRTFFQTLEALHGDGRKMGERIGSTAIWLNKPKTLRVIEPFDCSLGHACLRLFKAVWDI